MDIQKSLIHGASFSLIMSGIVMSNGVSPFSAFNIGLMGSKYFEVPFAVFAGALGIGTSLIVDATHNVVLSNFSSDKKTANREAMILALLVSGGAALALGEALNPDFVETVSGKVGFASAAAVSEVGATWVNEFWNGA